MNAVSNGDLPAMQKLLDAGADINARSVWGSTALMYAVKTERPEVVQLLLSRGANVNLKDKYGGTALASADSPAIVALLKKVGAKP
jgi:ankyrin repeat protein